ncbi:stalk domain-containing protein [Solibacillus sp. CAU 1738]|uniref:stalk domain-containing protein n=1 Tax=Solibacillus sp. CAU 1738 TaxID=3140363 RepID=UPI0032616696
MKKSIPFALAATLATSVLAVPVTFAKEEAVNTSLEISQEETSNFIKLSGKIGAIEPRTHDFQYSLIEKQDDIFAITFNPKTVVLDNTGKKVELKEGMEFTAFVNKNKPMLLIYPPQYSPEIIIVQTEAISTAEIGIFDKDFVNKTNSLQLNIADETEITDLAGKKLTPAEIVDKEVIVFYGITTRSIPAQTTPSKIIVLEGDQEETPAPVAETKDVIAEIIAKDQYIVNGITMVPLRLLAEEMGFTVKTTGKGAILTRGTESYTLKRGEKIYGHNRAVDYFEEAPALLETNKTYVPLEFINLLKGE